ncbi:MAG: prolipoprotein diacylglyceryl transferase [Alkaliphilus sp.]|nr:prolipoprotein diacylglyceryl transferase [Alkaliphilus sp.]
MNPVAFEIFGLDIRWYGILISVGILLGAFLAMKRATKEGVNDESITDIILIAIPSAIIGSRIYYVIFNWQYYSENISHIMNFREGGLAFHGGVIAGALSGYLYCRYKKLNFWKMADICAPSIVLGQVIGRWGNYINQEAFGRPTNLPWGILIDGVKVHPTFLYESMANLVVFFFLLWFDRKKSYNGQLFLLYSIFYSIIRFLNEGLRTDSLMLGNFRVAQLISIVIIVFSIIMMKYLEKRKLY